MIGCRIVGACLYGTIGIRKTPFLGVWFLGSGNSIIPYPVRGYLFLSNKKWCIYVACGVSQTPILIYI